MALKKEAKGQRKKEHHLKVQWRMKDLRKKAQGKRKVPRRVLTVRKMEVLMTKAREGLLRLEGLRRLAHRVKKIGAS